ncbi:MAG TPA: hypothetical protein VKI44_13225 [Acetobacteraceae bacterium]|jgi:DNA invertase Pin-like site-specific DNA recombinase|nr:hypothetical protein [Acetobacteraceae bacterium]
MHNPGMIYGYARVSTDGQSVDAQVRQPTTAEIAPRHGISPARSASHRTKAEQCKRQQGQ